MLFPGEYHHVTGTVDFHENPKQVPFIKIKRTLHTHVVTRVWAAPQNIYVQLLAPLSSSMVFSKILHPCHPNQAFHLIPCSRISLSQGGNRLWILDLSQVSQVSSFIPVTRGWRVLSFQNAHGSRRCALGLLFPKWPVLVSDHASWNLRRMKFWGVWLAELEKDGRKKQLEEFRNQNSFYLCGAMWSVFLQTIRSRLFWILSEPKATSLLAIFGQKSRNPKAVE